MAYFKDLTRYQYSENLFKCVGEPLSIGWLERCAPYPKGAVGSDLSAKLLALGKFPVNRYRGWHGCHFCEEYPVRITDGDGEFCLGGGEMRVPAKDESVTYVAPNLIYHYVVAHQYLPPDVFLDALHAFLLPDPAVVWMLDWIQFFPNQPAILSRLLETSLRLEKPSIPPNLRGAVDAAANDLKIAGSAGSDEREAAKNIVDRLKSVLTTPD